MKKKVISLILLLVGIAGANHAQSLWELIPLFPVDMPELIKRPEIKPLSNDGKWIHFEAEQTENEVAVTATENVGNVQVVIINAIGMPVYNAIEHIAADDVIRISTIGWQQGKYMLYIIRDNDAIGGEFEVR